MSENRKVIISVIMPVYNAQQNLEEAIKSVENSTLSSYELLLIDDGSTDNSPQICREFADKNEKIKYVRKENGGVASARNKGLEMAVGEYVAFLDADDSLSEEMLEKLYTTASNAKADVCMAGWNECYGSEKKENKIVSESLLVDGQERAKELALMLVTGGHISSSYKTIAPCFLGGVVWNGIYRRKFLEDNQIRFFCFWNNEDDWIFDIQCYSKADRVYFLEDCLYNYRVEDGSLSRKKRYIEDLYRRRKDGIDWICKTIDELCQNDQQKKNKAELYKGLLQRRLLLYTLFNETAVEKKMSSKEAIAYIKMAVKKEKECGLKDTLYYEAGMVEKVYTWLMLHHGVGISYLLNRYFVKKYR